MAGDRRVRSARRRPRSRFGDGPPARRRATHVQLAEFEGPLGLLLSLIEARQLDVLTVPLGALADAYLDALAALEADRLGNVSAFVAVASQLILIKSRAMLPRPPAVDPTRRCDEAPTPRPSCARRLLLYRAHRDAGLRLAERRPSRIGLFRREPAAAHAAGAGRRPAARRRRRSIRAARPRARPARRARPAARAAARGRAAHRSR